MCTVSLLLAAGHLNLSQDQCEKQHESFFFFLCIHLGWLVSWMNRRSPGIGRAHRPAQWGRHAGPIPGKEKPQESIDKSVLCREHVARGPASPQLAAGQGDQLNSSCPSDSFLLLIYVWQDYVTQYKSKCVYLKITSQSTNIYREI